ncbi:ornithine decarboxylase antizyme-domain-containing protein [Crucibulum laeve]|uniref:Ornithine decarboxylase antizyme n=1 Tax=Crucibulum laeve TaxID=68775 RepID=A0A5C3MGY0_9AGAR|nr:ornithine decarboxylase antizyme-domain-containing protein [Crucibulum laeve]
MGLSPSTTSPVCLPCAISRAPTTCTTTPLPSLAGPGGAFDVPKAKCPPDRGSSDCVTGSPASIFSTYNHSISSSPDSLSFSKPISYPKPQVPITSIDYSNFTRSSSPRAIPSRNNSDLSTPPLTPDGGSEYSRSDSSTGIHSKCENDALDFLMTVFPHQGLSALPHAKSVSISAPNMGASFEGVVLELPAKPKTLYVDGKSAESVSLRESVVALLDLADEKLECNALIIVLERSSPNLGDLLHSLMYVGGTVVTKPPFKVDPAFILVGLEI